MKKTIVFNWKMGPATLQEAEQIIKIVLNSKSIVCPPFIYLEPLLRLLKTKTQKLKTSLGAQDVFWENPPAGGAYTGEISPKMLKNLGVEYVIIGHSERRNYLGETDEVINKKVKPALATGLKVILCVGESLKIRKKGKKAIKSFIKNQLQKDLKNISLNSRLIVAYEPIWAIGTGNYCQPEDALEIIKFIKQFLTSNFRFPKPKVLYGGSVTSKNIKDYLKFKEIDGVLIGGASINQKELKKILNNI